MKKRQAEWYAPDAAQKERRKFVQRYAEGVEGFCTACGAPLYSTLYKAPIDERRCPACGCSRSILVDFEVTDMHIEVNGKKYKDVSPHNWKRLIVRNEERFYKRMTDGEMVMFTRMEAIQRGVIVEPISTERAPEIPSAPITTMVPGGRPVQGSGGGFRSAVERASGKTVEPITFQTGGRSKQKRLGQSGLLSHGWQAGELSKAAKKFAQKQKASANKPSRSPADDMRSQFVKTHITNKNGKGK